MLSIFKSFLKKLKKNKRLINMPKRNLTEDEVFKILKKFTLECVHGGDFDQGNTEEETLSVLKNWWNKEKNKFNK